MVKVYQAAAKEIRSGHIAAVYIITGNEDWSRGKLLALLKKKVLDPTMADFNFDQLNAQEVKGVTLADKAGMLPMMADRRLIIVEQCDKWKQADLKAITEYMGGPNESTCLILQFAGADRRKKLFKFKSPLIRYLEFNKPRPWELAEYISALAREMKLSLTEEALALVAEFAGDDLGIVHRELDKLSLYKLGSNQVGPEDVGAIMGRTRHVTRWELDEFIGSRNLHGALVKLHDILASGEEPVGLLSTINMFIKRLFTVKALMTKGVRDPYQVGQALGVPGRIAEKIIRQQQAYSDPELRAAFVLLRETDYRLKSAAMDRRLLLDHLLCRIIPLGPFSPPAPKPRPARR